MSTIKSNSKIFNEIVTLETTMSAREEIKSILAKENMTMTELAEKIPTSVNNLSNKLRKKTIKFEEVCQIADILGCHIKFEKNTT